MRSIFMMLAALVVASPVAAQKSPAPVAPPPLVRLPEPPAPPRSTLPPLPDPGPVTPARLALATELSKVTSPAELMIEAVTAGWEAGLREDKALKDLDATVPGLGSALEEAGRTLMVTIVRAETPALQASIAKIYSEDATEDDIRTYLEFYRSPVGQNMIRKLTMSTEGVSDSDEAVTVDDLMKINRKEAMKMAQTFTKEETLQVMKLAFSPAGRRMRPIGGKVQAVMANWMNKVIVDFSARFTPIAEDIVQRRTGA